MDFFPPYLDSTVPCTSPGIYDETAVIVDSLREKLKERFGDVTSTPQQLAECVELLLELGEPPELLCQDFLNHSQLKLDEDLAALQAQLEVRTTLSKAPSLSTSKGRESPFARESSVDDPTLEGDGGRRASTARTIDVLEFVDEGSNGFLSNICLVIASYNEMFLWNAKMSQVSENLDSIALKKLVAFVHALMERYFSLVSARVSLERETGENSILVRALDRFHRRLQAMNKLLPDTDFSRAGIDIVSRAAKDRIAFYRDALRLHFMDCVTDVRQSLAAPKTMSPGSVETDGRNSPSLSVDGASLSKLQFHLLTSLTEQFKSVLGHLQTFTKEENTFALKSYFRAPFCSAVHQELLLGFLTTVFQICADYCDGAAEKSSNFPPALLLILSRFTQVFSKVF